MRRQFGLSQLLILITLFGMLFAILEICKAYAIVYLFVVIYFVIIGVAQAFLFKGNKPRKASVTVGGYIGGFFGLLCGGLIGTSILREIYNGITFFGIVLGPIIFFGGILIGTAIGFINGCLDGYLAGCLIAGIFLVREQEPVEEDDTKRKFDDGAEET
jgi:hypothetical protein